MVVILIILALLLIFLVVWIFNSRIDHLEKKMMPNPETDRMIVRDFKLSAKLSCD